MPLPHATLVVELVDRTIPHRPVVLKRDGVHVTLDDGVDTRHERWLVRGDQVRGGHQLAQGDVIYTRTADDRLWWLAEVAHVWGTPARRLYNLLRLHPVDREDSVATNNDPRWEYQAPAPPTDEQLPLDLGR